MNQAIRQALFIGLGIVAGSTSTVVFQQIRSSAVRSEDAQAREVPTTLATPIHIKGDPILGDANAPLTIVLFSDYQCPYCKRFHDQALPKLKQEYINKGVVRLIHKDLPLPFHSSARLAAKVARCTQDNHEYWKVHSALFSKQDCLSCLGPSEIAQSLKVNQGSISKECINSKRISLAIASNISEARLNNIKGTPTFVIGPSQDKKHSGTIVEGAIAWPDFRAKIEGELRKIKR